MGISLHKRPSVKTPSTVVLLPLVGFLAYIPEAAIGHPNLLWAGVLFCWTLTAMALAWWILHADSTRLLERLDRNANKVALGAISGAAFLFIAWSFYQAYCFAAGPGAEDTAYYSQVLWNTLHGNFLSGNIQQERLYFPPVKNDLALHFSPALVAIVLPAYAVLPHFLTLLVIRDLAIAAAAWPLFLLAREQLGGLGGIAAVFLYLANPVVVTQGTEAFLLLQLAPLPFFWAFRAFVKEDFSYFLVWVGVVMAVREDAAITCAGFGLWALLSGRSFKWWCAGLGLPILWWALATEFIQPRFGGWHSGGLQAALAGGGGTLLGAYKVLLTRPSWILAALHEGGLLFLYQLFRYVGFLAALGTEAFLTVPVMTAILFLKREVHNALFPFSHFALLPSCALVGGTVVIVYRMARNHHWNLRIFAVIMLFLLPSASLLDGVKTAVQERLRSNTFRNDASALREAIRLIPENAAVAASNYALPALSKRHKLYYLQYIHGSVGLQDIALPETETGEKGRWSRVYPYVQLDYILLDQNLDRVATNVELRKRYLALVEELSHSAEYETIWKKGEYSLLRRKQSPPAA